MVGQKPIGKLTKVDAYREAEERGVGFIANVIANWHRKPFAKLVGLVALLRAGRTVRIADFDMDSLVIDGERADWSALERVADDVA